jgi:hypothetical protein
LDVESRLADQSRQLQEQRQELIAEQQQLAARPLELDAALQTKAAELERDRLALEEELENVRTRAVGMAQTISEQKRQMADEHAQWAAELRQLRRILDKQATWIAQQSESGSFQWVPGSYGVSGTPIAHSANGMPPQNYPLNIRPPEAEHRHRETAGSADPVLGSVLSQFELLQKDVARRRNQSAHEQINKRGDNS